MTGIFDDAFILSPLIEDQSTARDFTDYIGITVPDTACVADNSELLSSRKRE
jgi:hypothetical protein